jgi:hypothetical protein
MILVYITGSRGTIGKQIHSYLNRKKNIFVVPIIREKSSEYENYIFWDYFNNKTPYEIKGHSLNNNQSFLIHCGYDFSDKNIINNSNYIATKNLLSFFNRTKIINISTMSAYEGCFSIYGKNKLSIEKLVEIEHGYNLRMGIPITPKNKKSIGFLGIQEVINNLFPFFTFAIDTKNNGLIFLSYLPIFNNVIYKILCNTIPPGTYSIVKKNPINMFNFIKMRTNKIIIKIDWRLVYLFFKFAEFFKFKFRFGSDSLIGLVKSNNSIEKPLLYK